VNPPQYLGVTSTTLAVFAARTKVPYGTYLARGCLYLPSPNRLDKLPEKPHGERSTSHARSASVYVAGAGNSAGQGVMHLSKYAFRVTLLVRGDSLSASMSEYLIKEIGISENKGIRLNTQVIDGGREGRLEYPVLEDATSAPTDTVPAAALFILIGAEPHTSCLPEKIQRDEKGYVVTKDLSLYGCPRRGWHLERLTLFMETGMSGAFAVGDARHASVKRVASAEVRAS
jgi:thioredoxin reductase (NADPH)